ncbi:zinc finger protein ZAT7-like [Zingiber officinale]|uniref:C2H2-type domain-containing protein n=1 Tax=Zingiber officinale TaxID=94328 RepID=A0A8J5I8S0_ZINOF|nr:zinc finger protein ZAT7-like [Zingiber officinale]KAG6530955.1 hypothetical protein ZIOFF_004725 [Zingiber officinale]
MKRSSYRFGGEAGIDSIDMAGILMLLSRGGGGEGGAGDESRVFECKTCSRRFPSYQALGGHRASHKKPRLVAAGDEAEKPRSHECTVCGLEFAVGQALGGHMRRHRVPSSSLFERGAEAAAVEREGMRGVVLDLNLPAPLENSVVDLKLGLGLTTNLVESVDN